MMLDLAFDEFSKALEKRMKMEQDTREDSIRFILAYFVKTNLNIDINDIVLEFPHRNIELYKRAHVDLYVQPNKDRIQELIFEIKYDRRVKTNSGTTAKAGKIFNDINRLAYFDQVDEIENNIERFFVYITDDEMQSYLLNNTDLLRSFFNLELRERLTLTKKIINHQPETFRKKIRLANKFANCILIKVFQRDIINSNFIRIYNIKRE